MSRRTAPISIIAVFLAGWATAALAGPSVKDIDIPYQKFVLKNGLTLIVHEDHKAPIVSVNIWYHVGSKNEKEGRTGFAHLFEHLMFNGSENNNDDYFQAMERIGATELNGTTGEDRTNYFQNVPTSAVDVALWMESDRMGHLLGAIDQAKLDEQRGVVQNEKRQYENEPYGRVDELITEATYPKGHPYSWTVIGSMADLNAASLDDVKEWFKTYYGPSNATLVVAGDITPAEALRKVEHYFGDIPPGPPIAKFESWPAKRSGSQRQILSDRVPQARLYKIWNVPAWGDEELAHLDLVSDVLGLGKNSRLYKRLVYDDQTATSVSCSYAPGEIGSKFQIVATAKPGGDLAAIEKAIDEELARFLKKGATAAELKRIKAQHIARFIRGIERIGGFGGKSDILAQSQVYGGSPEAYKTYLGYIDRTTRADLQRAAKKWLSDGDYNLEVHPFPNLAASAKHADRSKLPTPGDPPQVTFPARSTALLDNGLKVILVERKSIPAVEMALVFDAGYAADKSARPGTAMLAMNMLDEGTKKRTSMQISEQLALLGAELGAGSDLDASVVHLSALKANLKQSIEIFADVVQNPSFPEKEVKRVRAIQLAGIQREKVSPVTMALRVFPRLIYGEGHAYGNPLTGSGTEASVAAIGRKDLQKFHQTWMTPNNATLVVVGDVGMKALLPLIKKTFGGWKKGPTPKKDIAEVALADARSVYLIDRPGAPSSIVFCGHLAPPKSDPEDLAISTMNRILGGSFTSRINMNLREDKHWSYGARSIIPGARGPRPFLVFSIVQGDKTKEAMIEVDREISGIKGDKPPTDGELDKSRRALILSLPGGWEQNGAIMSDLLDELRYGLPEDYWNAYPDKVRALDTATLAKAANRVLHPDRLVWVIVGDAEKIGPSLDALGWGNVQRIDADGKPVK